MGKLTITGWLVFLVSLVVGIAAGTVFLLWWQQVFPNAHWRVRTAPGGLVVVATTVGLFWLGKMLFKVMGRNIVRESH
jgi:NO-binding membrane sensor protein with MHYT domain